ncbi:MAG TPA: serine hydrolase [Chitinophagaceae bacterium]
MKNKLCHFILFIFHCFIALKISAQPGTDKWLQQLLYNHASPLLAHILNTPDSFQYQIVYTQINRDRDNNPHFKNFYLHVDSNQYFNPASTVKLPVALLALEKLNELQVQGLDMNTTMLTDSAYSKQEKVYTDSTAQNNLPSVAQYIKRIFLISDNDAYNRLYEFVGQQTINEKLWQKGYTGTRITRRFVQMNEEENRHTNPIRFMQNDSLIYSQPPVYSNIQFDFSKKHLAGNGYYDNDSNLIMQPKDFTRHNLFSLEDMQRMLQAVLFPESVPQQQRFNLTDEQYKFLYKYMSQYPSETVYPKYDTTEYFNSYTKFFFFRAFKSEVPSYIRVFNKAGWTYGFLSDIAYIADFKNHVEFMLTATIYTNHDGILNDDKYDYEDAGFPFFKEAGNIIYDYELHRKRKHQPDLGRFIIQYDK